ncbi:hypothetical protein GCM10022237_18690 [Nocardioides ginsengisoli]
MPGDELNCRGPVDDLVIGNWEPSSSAIGSRWYVPTADIATCVDELTARGVIEMGVVSALLPT